MATDGNGDLPTVAPALESGELPDEPVIPRSRSRSPGARDHHRRYGRSRSPAARGQEPEPRRQHSRSRSRDRHGSRKNKGGFKWKEKSSNAEGDSKTRLERGYRGQDRRDRDRFRERSRDRDRSRDREHGRDRRFQEDDRRDRHRRDDEQYRGRDSRDSRGGRHHENQDDKERDQRGAGSGGLKEKKEKREKQITAPTASQTMIVVYINDRLGTKAGIPCLPSDPIKLFKAQVAARIGREPHEIMLKRQGERPFKDQLTLEDYGVSNGVQLDLELDTGE